jgi:hypothetical protein
VEIKTIQKIKIIVAQNNDLTLIFPKEYRNEAWMNDFGEIQLMLRNLSIDDIKIKFDLSNLTWIDPLPLLSICISIEELEKAKVDILLPDIGSNNKESNKLLAFFYSEGFFDQFSNNEKVRFIENKTIEVKDYTKFGALIGELQFKDCGIIKAQVVDLEEIVIHNKKTIDDWINDLVNRSQYYLRNKVESYRVDEIINRLQRLLSETATNVYEHAYEGINKKYIGIYVRFRNGLANTRISDKERLELKKILILEQNNSPLLNWWFIDNVFNFIEVFIIDAGNGLSNNYYNESNKPQWPFALAWEDAVINGIRGKNKIVKRTQFGGLYSICRNLGHNYVWARDANQCIGHSLPLRTGIVPSEGIITDQQIKGLSLVFRLTWDIATDDETTWERVEFNHEHLETNPYFQELSESKDIYHRFYGKNLDENLNKSYIFVVDDRFKFTRKYSEIIYSRDRINTRFCIYLPGQFMQKNRILTNVNELFSGLVCSSRTLIICDIVPYEANLFELALEKATFTQKFLDSFDSIILITQRFSILYLDKDGNTFYRNTNLANDFISNIPARFAPHLSLRHIIAWLKTHDSLLFWLIIKDKSKINNSLFINGKIIWYRDDVEYEMDGYLNFAQVITDVEVRKIVETSLSRTLCLSNYWGIQFNNIDILTSQLASKMNSHFPYYQSAMNSDQFEILLGSILVTGLAEYNAQQQISLELKQIPIHFFIHQSIRETKNKKEINNSNKNFPHLFLWPKEWLTNNFPFVNRDFRRVGSSHVIAPYGWKYYPIPRFLLYNKKKEVFVNDYAEIENKNDCEFISAYACTPSETYNDWQISGKQILEIGHYHYENKHDLFKIDFPMAINDSFNEGGKLAVFLLAEFLVALGTNTSSIISNNFDIYNATQKEKTKKTDEILDKNIQRFVKSVEIYI